MNSIFFYRTMAKVYDLLDVIYFRDYDHSPRKITNDRIRSRDKVLDLCTGTATNAMNLAGQNPGTKVVGIDISKDMLRVAKVKVKRSGLGNIRLYKMDATDLKFRKRCFDKILISLVLHELEDETRVCFQDGFLFGRA